jgi:hypothetical protein
MKQYFTLRSVSSLNNPQNNETNFLIKIWSRHVENHHNYYDRLHSKYITQITIDIIVKDHGNNNKRVLGKKSALHFSKVLKFMKEWVPYTFLRLSNSLKEYLTLL